MFITKFENTISCRIIQNKKKIKLPKEKQRKKYSQKRNPLEEKDIEMWITGKLTKLKDDETQVKNTYLIPQKK